MSIITCFEQSEVRSNWSGQHVEPVYVIAAVSRLTSSESRFALLHLPSRFPHYNTLYSSRRTFF
jgi:hypothetical protein